MPDYEQELVESLTRVIKRACDASPEAKSIVRTVGLWLTRLADAEPPTSTTDVSGERGAHDQAIALEPLVSTFPTTESLDKQGAAPAPQDAEPQLAALVETVPLRIGDARLPVSVPGSADDIRAARHSAQRPETSAPVPQDPGWAARDLPDLTHIARRCRIKAAACRAIVGITDHRAGSDQELARCKAQAVSLPSCDLWMEDEGEQVVGIDTLAACFDNVAAVTEGLDVAIKKRADRPRLEDLMFLMAEAQSALRMAAERTGVLKEDDHDQEQAFRWLRVTTEREQVFIARHMRQTDRAEPNDHAGLANRIEAACAPFTKVVERDRKVEVLLKKIGYHAGRIERGAGFGGVDGDWKTISDTIEKLSEVTAPTIVPLRDLLLPIMDVLPEELDISQSMEIALDSAEKVRERSVESTVERPRAESDDVRRVRSKLRGLRVVLVGGEVYEHRRAAIERAFELGSCEWATTSEHGSSGPLVSAVKRPDTRLVLVLIRLAGHLHVEDVAGACADVGVPLVRVPAGYGVTQLARHIMEQASDRLPSRESVE